MNATAYISSGILERHLVGLTSPEEVRELGEMVAQHPEVLEEIQSIQKALHGYVLAHQVSPPEDLRQKIMTGTKVGAPSTDKRSTSKSKVVKSSSGSKTLKVEMETPPVNWWIVATVALALGLIALGVHASRLLAKEEASKTKIAELETEVSQLKTQKEAQIKQYEEAKAALDLRSSHDLMPIRIQGNHRAPGTNAIVFSNDKTKKSYLDVRSLPDVPEGKQLQMWVTANGKTENLGSPKTNEPGEFPDLKFIQSPSIYFVTMENAGDAPERPNRWQIVMIGRVNN